MSIAIFFGGVSNLYNLHFLLENLMCEPDPVNSYRDVFIVVVIVV